MSVSFTTTGPDYANVRTILAGSQEASREVRVRVGNAVSNLRYTLKNLALLKPSSLGRCLVKNLLSWRSII